METTDTRRERELGEAAGRVVKVAYDVLAENLQRGRKVASGIAAGERSKRGDPTAQRTPGEAGTEVRQLGEAAARFVEAVVLAASGFGSGFMEGVDRGQEAPPSRPDSGQVTDRAAALFMESVAQVVAPLTSRLKHRRDRDSTGERRSPLPVTLEERKEEQGTFHGQFRVQNVTGLNGRFEFTSNGLLGPRGNRISAESVRFATLAPLGGGGSRESVSSREWQDRVSVYIPAGQAATIEVRVRPSSPTAPGVYDGVVIGESPTLQNHLPDLETQRRAIQLTIVERKEQAAEDSA